MNNSEPNNLTKRLLIKTFRTYAKTYLDEMSNKMIESITDNLSEYANAIQSQLPQLWSWLNDRAKFPLHEREPIDKAFWDSLKDEPDAHVWVADLWEVYLNRHPQDQVLFDLALNKVYEGVSDHEIQSMIEALQP